VNEHESNLIIGVRLLDSAVAVLQAVDFSQVEDKAAFMASNTSELAMHNLLTELEYLNRAYSSLLTGDPE
tara:strand:+ start:196 stop:405 length:210 start_codon:yes stop_codon:yes gene_type:complete